jgi:metal-dependent hydrolase (beta-lactamase superfamily II)
MDGVTVVDCGLPKYGPQLPAALRLIGRGLEDVKAILLTHAHADHLGFAESWRRALGVPVYVHAADEEAARTGVVQRPEASMWPYLRCAGTYRLLAHFIKRLHERPGEESERTEEELQILVDYGVRVLDVIVEHPLYGELRGSLMLESRADVQDFLTQVRSSKATLLSALTGGVHLHTVEASRPEAIARAKAELRKRGILLK